MQKKIGNLKIILSFNERDLSISINKINNLPDSFIVDYFVKIIVKENYIENEKIKTIAITQTIGNSYIKGVNQNDIIMFYLNYGINKMNFYSNAYYKIIGENYDIDYLSYNRLIFGGMNKMSQNQITLIIILLLYQFQELFFCLYLY